MSRLLGLAALALAAACSEPEPGELPPTLRVAVSTDMGSDTIDGMRITVARGGDEVFAETYGGDVVAALPDSLLLENAQRSDDTGDPILTPIAIRVVGTLAGDDVLDRSATLVFQNDEAKLLRLPLCQACVGVPCDAGETCRRGECASDQVDVDSLPADGDGVELAGECAAD